MSIFTIGELLGKDSSKNFYRGLIIIALLSLGIAYFVEYIMHIPPCILCIYQRIPYFIIIILSIGGLLIKKHNEYIIFFIESTLFIAILLAAYHSGIEHHIFEPTALCSSSNISFAENLSINEIRDKLYNEDIATCSKAALKILGLSMSEWNLLLNIGLFFIGILAYRETNYAKTHF